MLRFNSLQVKNFVIYRDQGFSFAVDPDRNVTVIRGTNASGKTTLLRAMEWALYGARALPRGPAEAIHPPGWNFTTDGPCEVEVRLTFTTNKLSVGSVEGLTSEQADFELIRRTTVAADGDGTWTRSGSKVTLLVDAGDAGHRPYDGDAGREVAALIPFELREFFFTDGDKAMQYLGVDDDASVKGRRSRAKSDSSRDNVTHSIDLLLGLAALKKVQAQLSTVKNSLHRKVVSESGDEDAKALQEQLDRLDEKLKGLQDRQGELESRKKHLTEQIKDFDALIERKLAGGDLDSVKSRIEDTDRQLATALSQYEDDTRRGADLFACRPFFTTLMHEVTCNVSRSLSSLAEDGIIPATYWGFVNGRLQDGECICGTDLSEGTKAHDKVKNLLAMSKDERDQRSHEYDIYEEARSMAEQVHAGTDAWADDLRDALRARDRATGTVDELKVRLRELEAQRAELERSGVPELKRQRDQHRDARDGVERDLLLIRGEIADEQQRKATIEAEQARLTRLDEKATQTRYRYDAARDLLQTIEAALNDIASDTVAKVSDVMDSLFHQMIAASPDADLIRRVGLRSPETGQFEVYAHGPAGDELDLRTQLNGASRRALTLSFVLAISKVADIEAPHVIDTPLGMMDAHVKKSTFTTTADEVSQVLLMLTTSEINGIESLLDEDVGASYTITNQAQIDQIARRTSQLDETLVCACSHRQYCEVCERPGELDATTMSKRS